MINPFLVSKTFLNSVSVNSRNSLSDIFKTAVYYCSQHDLSSLYKKVLQINI